MLVDIGANLTHSGFAHDLGEVVGRARAAGVSVMIVTGTDVTHSQAAQALAECYPGTLYATAGMHPHEAIEFTGAVLDALAGVATRPGVVALGECGLDFNRDYSPRDVQRRCFEAQLELAAALQLPVFLHQRDAHEEFVRIVARYRSRLVDAVAHCFTGDMEQAAAYLDLDLHIGVTGWICDERRGHALRESVRRIPLERLMIETDAPYLLPRDLKPAPKTRRNEPAFLPHVCTAVARELDADFAVVAAATTRTAQRFFRLPARSPLAS